MAEELEAVGLGPGKGLFVAKDDAGGIFLELACADEAAAGAALFGAGYGVFLEISVEGRSGILLDDVAANPVFEGSGCAGIHVILRRVVGIAEALLDGNEVMRVGGVVFFLHSRRNLVVGLREDTFERCAGRVVTKPAKGKNLGHGDSGNSLCCRGDLPVYAKRRRFRKVGTLKFSGKSDGSLARVGNARRIRINSLWRRRIVLPSMR